MTIKTTHYKKGFSLIELVIYVAGMIVLLGAVTTLIVSMYGMYRTATISSRVDQIGISVADRITKDIRTGISFNPAQSQFGIPTGALSLNAQAGANPLTKYFALQSGRLVYQENGGAVQYLTPKDVSVSNFNLASISTTVSEGVHFIIGIDYVLGGQSLTRTYSGVAILRHSYQ